MARACAPVGDVDEEVGVVERLVVRAPVVVARSIARGELLDEPLLTEMIQTQRAILPGGRPVASAHPYAGYLGGDRAFGRLTVRYPGTGPLDVYAGIGTLAAEVADTMGQALPVEEHEPVPA